VERLFHLDNHPLPAQSEIIGALCDSAAPRDVLVSAAGSHPGDLHKLWRARTPNSYHMEYGFSCMGYEISAAIGVKMADPTREVYAFVGDGTYLMMPSEILTAVQEGMKVIIVVVDNHGFASIGGLSSSLGSGGFWQRASASAQAAPRRSRWGDAGNRLCRQRAQSRRRRRCPSRPVADFNSAASRRASETRLTSRPSRPIAKRASPATTPGGTWQ
jgi:hypothetical protein